MMTKEEIIELAGHREVPAWVMKLVGDAVAKERAECAKVCKQHGNDFYCEHITDSLYKKIRARGQE